MKISHLALALVLPVFLSACGSGSPQSVGMHDDDIMKLHPLQAEQTKRVISLALSADGKSVSEASKIQPIALDIARRGHGPVVVAGPASATSFVILNLVRSGVPASQILQKQVGGSSEVNISFTAYTAVVPRCGQFYDDSSVYGTATPKNNVNSEWGCSTQHNLAEMVSDPLDLVRMHGPETVTDSYNPVARVQDEIRTYSPPPKVSTGGGAK